MKKLLLIAIPAFCVASVARAQFDIEAIKAKMGEMQKSPKDTSKAGTKKTTVADKTKGTTKHEGLFTLYQDTATGSMQMYVRKDQLGKEFIYQSFSINGPTELFLNQNMIRATMVFKMVRAFDKIEFHLVNTDFYYDKDNPVSKTANVDKPEAVFYVDKFAVEDSLGYLVSGDGLFISEKLDPVKPATLGFNPFASFTFGLGQLSSSKSKYVNVRSFPNNTDVVVDMAYDNPSAVIGASAVTDPRYVRVRMQHSFIEMPNNGFKPRKDDQRVGYFMDQVTNMTSTSPVPYKDMIHRWNLVKKDPTVALSEPVEPIVWWVENTTPLEYRQTIVEAGLKWNEAFEKAGFKNAVQMKIMPDTASWDPADIRYNVIRWVASAAPSYGAIGPSFSNPKTGQLLGADITVEWFSGSATPISDELYNGSTANFNVNSIFTNNNESTQEFSKLYNNHNHNNCSIAAELKAQYVTGLTALEAAGASEVEIKTMHKQFLTYLIMHEMGHTMGLMHNMKASQMLSPAEVNNTEITHKIGTMASVMDYPSINVALDKTKQGDYYTTKAGPYDLWAIEYGYRQFENSYDEEMGLAKILSRSNDPQLIFGNDGDDMRSPGRGIDPRVNVNDFTNDMMTYAEDRYKLVNNLMGKLVAKYAKPNQSYAELRARYGTVNRQRSDMTNALSRYIGGIYIDRSQPEQKSANKPMMPTPVATQKKAMELISKYVFAPNAFDADANVFPYLQRQRRGYDQGAGEDFKITTVPYSMQMSALAHILHPNTLARVTNTRLYGNTYSSADIMSDLQKGIFDADINTNVNVYRQNAQTSYVELLALIASGKAGHDDLAISAARYTLRKIKTKLAVAVSTNEETKAHRANLIFLIDDATTVK